MCKPRKPKYGTDYIIERMNIYTNESDVPILKELCYLEDWNYQTIMKYAQDRPKIRTAIDRMMMKKEAQVEKGSLTGKLNTTQAIFTLKQLGWRNRDEVAVGSAQDFEDLTPLADLIRAK